MLEAKAYCQSHEKSQSHISCESQTVPVTIIVKPNTNRFIVNNVKLNNINSFEQLRINGAKIRFLAHSYFHITELMTIINK